jgi:DNA-binding NarL/FixJ family response regulator
VGLKRALERESDLKVLWELPNANNIDALMRRSPVDLILMDLYMGNGKDGVVATREVTDKWPRVKVVVISASIDDRGVLASARAGADGFLAKDLSVEDMVASIRRLAAGEVSRGRITGDLLEEVRGRSRRAALRGGRPAGGVEGLSPRQRQVLEELRLGHTNREIAERLGIAVGTVNKHVHEVLTVLKVRNRTQAAATAGRDAG